MKTSPPIRLAYRISYWLSVAFTLLIPSAFNPKLAGAEQASAEAIAEGSNQFAFELYSKLAKDSTENVFFSPYSISAALSMTAAGAAGKTYDQLAAALHFPASGEALFKGIQSVSESLLETTADGKLKLDIANAIWAQQGYQLKPTFTELLTSYYKAEARIADFQTAAEQARAEINTWVEQKTNDKIKDLLQPGSLPPDTRLVLVNAVYFLASWATQFEPNLTNEAPFTKADGSTVQAPFMRQLESISYAATDTAQIVELPYVGGRLAMTIVVPKELGASALAEVTSESKIRAAIQALETKKVDLYLPKFKSESSFGLKDALSALGIRSAFVAGEADFSGMNGNREFFIGAVIHQSFISVDEAGTEAAAATAVVMRAGSAPLPEEIVELKVDRPFFYVIRDRKTGLILFMGHVHQPSSEN